MAKNEKESTEEREVYCCVCPYCDVDLEESFPFCRICGSQLRYCAECGAVVTKEDMECPNCGAKRVVQE